FTGHVNDTNTGLVQMQQRYYDPVAGRFLSIDPVLTDVNTAASFNRYNYANDNPYKYTDPDGRAVDSITIDSNKNVHIIMGISYRGAVSEEQGRSLNHAIFEAYSGKKGDYAVNVTIIPAEQAKYGNIVTVEEGTGRSVTNGSRFTTLRTSDPTGATMSEAMVHEAGHLMGIGIDKYYSNGKPKAGWEGNVMASPKGGVVEEKNIKEIIDNNGPFVNKEKVESRND
ncbi:RHS repeat-associated core domain-containing protein, partial [Pseudoduganella violaceinigra]|uniref:RHS repeat-associated core domain-containing protein n=1 Tax=Pseudoduganella violaceinigra TaxID=246602 RepID=UPI000554997B